jgi:hypothetical protein
LAAIRNRTAADTPQNIAMKISGHKTPTVFERYNIKLDREVLATMEKTDAYRDREAAK